MKNTASLRFFKVNLAFFPPAFCYSHGAMMNKFEIEDRLREELETSQKRLDRAMTSFRLAATETDSGADEILGLASSAQKAARENVLEAMHRLNQFFLVGAVPEGLAERAAAANA